MLKVSETFFFLVLIKALSSCGWMGSFFCWRAFMALAVLGGLWGTALGWAECAFGSQTFCFLLFRGRRDRGSQQWPRLFKVYFAIIYIYIYIYTYIYLPLHLIHIYIYTHTNTIWCINVSFYFFLISTNTILFYFIFISTNIYIYIYIYIDTPTITIFFF